jgi:hypothetical protein
MIRSVLGRIDLARLGVTVLHAHSSDDPQAAAAELQAFARAGGVTVIQTKPTTIDGVRLAEATGVNIVPLPESLEYLQAVDACQAFLEMDRLQATGIDLRNVTVQGAKAMLSDLGAWCSIAVRGAWPAVETRQPGWLSVITGLVDAGWVGQLLVATRVCGTLDGTIEGLRDAGFSDFVVDALLIRNPQGYLENGAHIRT